MQNGCNLIVPHSFFIRVFESEEECLNKYNRRLCLSFTEDNQEVKWCPNKKGCEYAVNKVSDTLTHTVECLCGFNFCYKCSYEAHRPADCEMIDKWEKKNSSESENVNWILVNTKQCPNKKCGRPIEKNTGCNHMQC